MMQRVWLAQKVSPDFPQETKLGVSTVQNVKTKPCLSRIEKVIIIFGEIFLFIALVYLSQYHENELFWPAEVYFQPTTTAEDQDDILTILRAFQRVIEASNVTYFLSGGSWLGAFRHHGIIPWDDDADVYVDRSQKSALKFALAKLRPEFDFQSDDDDRSLFDRRNIWKVFRPKSTHKFLHHKFTWPSIDIFFYSSNSETITDGLGSLDMKIKDVFPLKRRPFGRTVGLPNGKKNMNDTIWLPVPCTFPNPENLQICISRSYSHSVELPVFMWLQRIISCTRLSSQFPFVYSQQIAFINNASNVSVDELRIENRTIYKLYYENQRCDGTTNSHTIPLQLKILTPNPITGYSNTSVPEYLLTGFKVSC